MVKNDISSNQQQTQHNTLEQYKVKYKKKTPKGLKKPKKEKDHARAKLSI